MSIDKDTRAASDRARAEAAAILTETLKSDVETLKSETIVVKDLAVVAKDLSEGFRDESEIFASNSLASSVASQGFANDSEDSAENAESYMLAAMQAAIEALANTDIDPDYISYTVGVKPSTAGAVNGTIGAYITSANNLQKLVYNSGTTQWDDYGSPIVTLDTSIFMGFYNAENITTASELNAIILLAFNNGGGYIVLPKTTLVCEEQIVLRAGVHFLGARNTVLQLGFNGDLIDYTSGTFSFANVTFDGDKANFSGNGFNASNEGTSIRRFVFQSCIFSNFTGHAFIHKSTANFTFDNCNFAGCDDYLIEVSNEGTDSCRYGSYRDCEARNAKGLMIINDTMNNVNIFFRVQLLTGHCYEITANGLVTQSKIDGFYGNSDGSFMYCKGAISAQLTTRASNFCLNPPDEYGENDPSVLYFDNEANNEIVLVAGSFALGSAVEGTELITDTQSTRLTVVLLGSFSLSGSVQGGNYIALTSRPLLGTDFTNANEYLFLDSAKTAGALCTITSKKGVIRIGNRIGTADHTTEFLDATRTVNRVDASGGVATVKLPDPTGLDDGIEMTIMKLDATANAVNISDPGPGFGFYSNITQLTEQYECITVRLYGTIWYKK